MLFEGWRSKARGTKLLFYPENRNFKAWMLCPGLSMYICTLSQLCALLHSGQLLLKMLNTPCLWPWLAPWRHLLLDTNSFITEGGKGLHLETECATKRSETSVAFWKEKVSNSLTYTEGTTCSQQQSTGDLYFIPLIPSSNNWHTHFLSPTNNYFILDSAIFSSPSLQQHF